MGTNAEERTGRRELPLSYHEELASRPRRDENQTLVFVLPCGTRHREYGPATSGIKYGSSQYYLFGIHIEDRMFREIYEATASEINSTFGFARELIMRRKDTTEQVKRILEKYYGERLAKSLIASTLLRE